MVWQSKVMLWGPCLLGCSTLVCFAKLQLLGKPRLTWDGVALGGGGAHQLEALLRNLQVLLGLLLLAHCSIHHACKRWQECGAGMVCRKEKQTACCPIADYSRSAAPAEGLLVGTWQCTKTEQCNAGNTIN